MHLEFAMIDSIAAAVVVVDENGQVVAWNAACAALTGRPFEETRGQPALDLLVTPDEARKAVSPRASLGAALGEEMERPYLAKGGEERWIVWRVRPWARPEGVAYEVAFGLDVTDRRRAEAARQSAEATLSGVISIAIDGIIALDESQRITLFNEGAEQIFGYRQDEVVGESIELLLPLRFRGAHSGHIQQFASSPERARQMGQRSEVFGRRKSGEEFPAEAAIAKLKIDGRMIFTVVLRDITDRKGAEQRQQLLMEASNVLASSIDYQETLRAVAKLAVQALGGCCVIDIVDQETSRARRLTVIVREGAPLTIEEQWLDRSRPHLTQTALDRREGMLISDLQPGYLDGIVQSEELCRVIRETSPRSLIVVPLVAQDRVLGAIALLPGPSARYGQDELHLAEELARRAALAIDNALHYARAQSAVRTREEILAIVSHDLRNLLSQTLLGASFLAETATDESTIATIDIVRRSAERMNRLVGDLLDFANVAAGRLSISPRLTRAMDLVREALALLAPAAASGSLDLHAEVLSDGLVVVCDPGRILQVLSNLIGNAIKFSPPRNEIAVRVEPKPVELWFSVADHGQGIAEEQKPHVFDRYWRANGASTSGSGLGLAISKGIVEAHGGRIWLESESGVGSTFFFSLPMEPTPSPALTTSL